MDEQKEQLQMMSEIQIKRAFYLSLGTGVLLAVAFVITLFRSKVVYAGPIDTRIIVGGLSLLGFFGAWLCRRQHVALGISLVLAGWDIACLIVAFTLSGLGIISAVVVLVVTFGCALLVFPTKLANRANIVGIFVAAIPILLDIFEPYERVPNETSASTWIISAAFLLCYGALMIWQFKNYTLRMKLIVSMVAITFLSAVIITFVTLRSTLPALERNIGQQILSNANAHSYQIGSLFQEQIDLLSWLALNDTLQQAIQEQNVGYGTSDTLAIAAEIALREQAWLAAGDDDPLFQELLANKAALELHKFTYQYPAHVEVFVTDLHGGIVAMTNRTSDYAQADESWWQATYNNGKGADFVSASPVIDESVGNLYSVQIAMPLRDRDTGEVIGILRSTYLLSELSKLLAETWANQTEEVDIFFPGYPPLRIREGGLGEVDPDLWRHFYDLAQKYSYEQLSYEDEESLLAATFVRTPVGDSPINHLRWMVVFHRNAEDALVDIQQQTRFTTLISLLIILAASAMAIWLARVLMQPVNSLTAVAERVGQGDLSARAELETKDEVGRLANTFNAMAEQLQTTLQGLEERVAERTRALETSNEVSRRISTILDQRLLVHEVVGQVKQAFDYYHAQIYLFDENKESLLLVGGTGEAGQMMLERGHRVRAGRGLVGRAAENNLPVIVPDVFERDGWLPNPLLPNTQAEIAVPIAIGDNVLGVLDVQNSEVGSLTQADVDLLQSIANQVAIALQNARAYQQAQRQADREALIGNVSQQIRNSTSVSNALRIAARELGHALGTEVGVQLKRD